MFQVTESRDNLLPGIITNKKNIILPVDKYKLPAWSQRVFQLAFEAKQTPKLTPELRVTVEFGNVQWPPKGPRFINLETTEVNSVTNTDL